MPRVSNPWPRDPDETMATLKSRMTLMHPGTEILCITPILGGPLGRTIFISGSLKAQSSRRPCIRNRFREVALPVSRFIALYKNGEDPWGASKTKGLHVPECTSHWCTLDNHIYPGTHRQTMIDKCTVGNNYNQKLAPDQVLEIVRLSELGW